MIDWQSFVDDFKAACERSGNAGNSGNISDKSFNNNEIGVPTGVETTFPLVSAVGTLIKTSGNNKGDCDQRVSSSVPTVPTVPTVSEEGSAAFAECIRKLRATPAPEAFWGDRWQRIIDDSAAFVATWGDQAKALGWTERDLFGVYPTRPACRFDLMGMILLLDGGEVVALTDTTATIKKPSGSIQRFTRREQRGAVLLWELR